MNFALKMIAKGLQLSGMCTLPFAIYFGETEKSMSMELNYLVLGSAIFMVGYFIDVKFVKN